MGTPRPHLIWLALLVVPVLSSAQDRPAPTRTRVADGVYLFSTPPYGDVGLDGNSVAIVSGDGVLVFDSNGTPAAASAVLAEIHKITDAPIRYVVNSHWHWDHWYGTEVYKEAFPGVQIVAHERTRAMMMGPALEFNRPGIETQLPAYLRSLEKRLTSARAATPPSPDVARLDQLLQDDRFFLEQKRNVKHTFPTLTFDTRLTVFLGERRIDVLHDGPAVTPGDAYLYLPHDKILITGDLLVNPISFALSSYPTGWLRTLEKIDALDASVIVPGHGEPLKDEALLHATMDLFRRLLEGGKRAKQKGLDVDQAKASILPGLVDVRRAITNGASALDQAFDVQLVDWFLHRVYDELNGPLTDDIAPIPRS